MAQAEQKAQQQANEQNDQQQGALVATQSARFVSMVERQFAAEMGSSLQWTDYQKTLAQHLFLKVDAQLKALETKRLESNRGGTPITWENVNLPKLALDGVHRICLGLDALIPNHIHPIPYFNKRLGKYDLDLRIGYVGKLYCRQELAVERPIDVICHLVHETDEFVPHFRSATNEIESYEFRVPKPFDRGPVVGGFGYIMYEDPRKNRLVLVSMRDFEKAEAAAKSKDFWGDGKDDRWRHEMMYKTVVHRVADKIPLDPRKVNAPSYAYVEAQEDEEPFERQVMEDANGRVIDVGPDGYRMGSNGEIDSKAENGEAQTEAPGIREGQQQPAEAARTQKKDAGEQQALETGPGF